jgi:hypothetical protein
MQCAVCSMHCVLCITLAMSVVLVTFVERG